MNEQMEFPETFEKFAEQYGFNDDKKVYTNGSDLIQIFRVKQWLEHDNKLRTIETDTAYECGKYANKRKGVDMNIIENLETEVEKIKEEICDKYCKFPDQYGKTATGAEEMVDVVCKNCPLCRL